MGSAAVIRGTVKICSRHLKCDLGWPFERAVIVVRRVHQAAAFARPLARSDVGFQSQNRPIAELDDASLEIDAIVSRLKRKLSPRIAAVTRHDCLQRIWIED